MGHKKQKHFSVHAKDQDASQEKDKPRLREIAVLAFSGFGAIAFFYGNFLGHNSTLWIGYVGALFILAGIFVLAYGRFKPILLYLGSFIIAVFLFVLTYYLQTSETPVKQLIANQAPIQIKDSVITVLNDSIKRMQPSIAIAKTIESNANEKLNLAKKYFMSVNKPIISIDGFTIDTLLPDKQIAVHCIIENTGHALAKKVTYFVGTAFHSIRYYNGAFPIGTLLKAPPLAPQKSFLASCTSEKLLSQEFYNDMQAKKWFLYYYGIVYYYDEFGTKDSSAFCLFHDGNSKNDFTYDTSYTY